MHEASVAQTILEIVERTAAEHPGSRVARVYVVIGALAHIDSDALRFAFDVLKAKTACAAAALAIDRKALRGTCRSCGAAFEEETPSDACPSCGAGEIAWSGEQDSYVTAIDVEE